MDGWTGKVLDIDLRDGTVTTRYPERTLYEAFLGGRGLAGVFLLQETASPYDSPNPPICVFPGLFAGMGVPAAGHTSVMSRSALTGTVAEGRLGGTFGSLLKRAGFDGLVITGIARRKVGIEIVDDQISIQSCRDYEMVGQRLSDIGDETAVLAIGDAAWNGVLFSSPITDDGTAVIRGGGLGPVFAARNLAYIRVTGTGPVHVRDRDALTLQCADLQRLLDASPALMGGRGLHREGGMGLLSLLADRHMTPTHNFRQTHFVNPGDLLRPLQQCRPAAGCPGCPVRCGMETPCGRPLPAFDVLSHFTALVGNADPAEALDAAAFCAEVGLDPICAASVVAAMLEITDLSLEGGMLCALLRQILLEPSDQRSLSLGSKRYAASQGASDRSMSVKRMDLPAMDPRGAMGLALGFAVSTVGACWRRAIPIGYELLRKPVPLDRFSFTAKARLVQTCENAVAVLDALGVCHHLFFAISPGDLAGVLSTVTGMAPDASRLAVIGARIDYTERRLNDRFGIGGEDDLPSRFFDEPGCPAPGFDVPPIDRDAFLRCRERYYRLRGLSRSGRPTPETAERLGIE